MQFGSTFRQRLGVVATACLLSVALPADMAWAQKTKDKIPATAESTVAASSFSVDIPNIDAVGSNVDNDTLRSIFSGNVVDNADALAGLTATSITIPTITLTGSSTVDGVEHTGTVTFTDLVLSDVTDGDAASVTLSGVALDAGEEGSAEFGEFSAANFNIAGVLGLYGLVANSGTGDLETIYTDFSFAGGTFDAPEVSCTVGSVSAAEFKARPLKYTFAEMMALIQSLEGEDMPTGEQTGTLMRMYVDMFTAFETSPATFDGFDCDGTDTDGRTMSFSVAGMSMGGMSPGVYPSISMDGLDVTVEGDGSVQVGNVTIKETDLSAPIAAIQNGPAELDEAWFTANARSLIPAFGGFSFSDIDIDVPDPEADGERIAGSVGVIDLSLNAYNNGIPTAVSFTGENIVVDLPTDSADEQIQQLIDLGVTTVDAGFAIDTNWNEADNTIVINKVSLSAVDLASFALSGTITNASAALFGSDENQALAAAMGLAVSALKLDVTDAGLSDIILARVSADQGSDPATMRPVFAGLAEGTIVGVLAGAAEAQKVGAAINAFVSGKAKNLTIDLTAKEAPGLGLADFMAAESDPTVLIGKVNIDASAK